MSERSPLDPTQYLASPDIELLTQVFGLSVPCDLPIFEEFAGRCGVAVYVSPPPLADIESGALWFRDDKSQDDIANLSLPVRNLVDSILYNGLCGQPIGWMCAPINEGYELAVAVLKSSPQPQPE